MFVEERLDNFHEFSWKSEQWWAYGRPDFIIINIIILLLLFIMLAMACGKFKQRNLTVIHGKITPAAGMKHARLHGLWYVGTLLFWTQFSKLYELQSGLQQHGTWSSFKSWFSFIYVVILPADFCLLRFYYLLYCLQILFFQGNYIIWISTMSRVLTANLGTD